MLAALGDDKDKLVIDLSCRRRGDDRWFVAMNKWQTITDMEVTEGACEIFPLGEDDFLTICRIRVNQEPGTLLLRVPYPCRR